jgi:hypothetical protein
MDKLFQNIQQSLQTNDKNDKNNLLNSQQLNQENITKLLDSAVESVICGPECQKIKITEQLKQKYLDAETSMKTAPVKFEQSKKNYYTYSEGSAFYNNMLEEELKQKSEKISDLLAENFNDEVSSAQIMNTYLNTALINSGYTKELLKSYIEKNDVLKLKLKDKYGDILTNDRKTYYETEAIEKLEAWYKFWRIIYYLLVLVFSIAMFISPSQFTFIKKFVIFILLVFYPYYIDSVLRWIYGLYVNIYNNMPKNVYNNL